VLDYPEQGGHVGFATGRMPGSLDWLPLRMLNFLTAIETTEMAEA
jgi:predicted alpha/beta-fold hydrolase